MVLKLALLAYHMDKYATALFENLRKTSEHYVIFDKHRHQILAVALFNLCYVFYIIFVKHIKWCVVRLIIVQMDLPVDGVCTRSSKTRLVCVIGCLWTECNGSQLATASSVGNTLSDVCLLFHRLSHDQLDITWIVLGSQKMRFEPYLSNSVMLTPNEWAVWWKNWIENGCG